MQANERTDQKYLVRPASPEEAGLFYAQTPEQDEQLGTIGHVRIDFGHGGKEFWHTWHPRGPEELNSQEFKAELGEVVNQLRESVLQNLSAMRSYCYEHGGKIEGGICTQNYGYTVETERYRYLLRCNPIEGDYQAYLTCFDKQAQKMSLDSSIVGKVSFASGEQIEYTDPAEYLRTIREELPYHATSGFRYETLTNDPEVRKAVDDELYDLYGEENPRKLEEYEMAEKEMIWCPLSVRNLAELKRAIRPGVELMATYHAYHPDTVGLVRVVGKVQTNGFYSVIKDQPNHKWSTCNGGKGLWTSFEKAGDYIFDAHSFKVLDKRSRDAQVIYEMEIHDMEMSVGHQKHGEYQSDCTAEETSHMTMGGM